MYPLTAARIEPAPQLVRVFGSSGRSSDLPKKSRRCSSSSRRCFSISSATSVRGIFRNQQVPRNPMFSMFVVSRSSMSRAYVSREPLYSVNRSEEHTSELQSHSDLVCRLLLEKKKKNNRTLNDRK